MYPDPLPRQELVGGRVDSARQTRAEQFPDLGSQRIYKRPLPEERKGGGKLGVEKAELELLVKVRLDQLPRGVILQPRQYLVANTFVESADRDGVREWLRVNFERGEVQHPGVSGCHGRLSGK